MSFSNIRKKTVVKDRSDLIWKGDITQMVINRMFPPMDQIIGDIDMKNRSAAAEFVDWHLGEKGAAKTELANFFIEWGIKKYGKNISIYVTKDLFAVIGVFIESRQQHYGDILDDKPVQMIIHDDFLSQFGRDSKTSTRRLFTQTFQNTRHLAKYIDAHGNKRGRIIYIFNAQDWYTIDINCRRSGHALIYKTLPYDKSSLREFKAEHPRQAYEMLDDITEKLDQQFKDQSYKGKSYVKIGRKTCGYINSHLTTENYCLEFGEYWVNSRDLEELLNEADEAWALNYGDSLEDSTPTQIPASKNYEVGEVYFRQDYDRELPTEFVAGAFNYGFKYPYPRAKKAKYKPNIHWQPTYDYLVDMLPAEEIASGLGITSQNLYGDYKSRGYVQIVRREQLGHWCEQIPPRFEKEIEWQVITGQFQSDLKDQEAVDAKGLPGIGIHGEIKTRERKMSPSVKDFSTEGLAHLKAGGKTYFYQINIYRKRAKPAHRIIRYRVLIKQ